MRRYAYTVGMETPESRRQAGGLIHDARKKAKLSQRALAKAAGISETWLRALTVGLRGEDPQRAADTTWLALAKGVGLNPTGVFGALGRPLPEEDGPATADPDGRFAIERTTYKGALLDIVTDLEADTEDLPDEAADEIIRRSIDRMRAQLPMVTEMERRRWEREQERGE